MKVHLDSVGRPVMVGGGGGGEGGGGGGGGGGILNKTMKTKPIN